MTVEAPVTVDLGVLTDHRADIHTLSGHDRGVEARARLELDRLDSAAASVELVVPVTVKALSPSFLQGMLTRSIRQLGRDRFRNHYVFVTSKDIRDQVDDIVALVASRPA